MVCCSVRCFGCGSPSREVMLRNVAAVSRLAEHTPHQPCLPPSLYSSPSHLPASLLLVSLCSRASQLIPGWRLLGHVSQREKKCLDIFWPLTAKAKEKPVSVCIHSWGGVTISSTCLGWGGFLCDEGYHPRHKRWQRARSDTSAWFLEQLRRQPAQQGEHLQEFDYSTFLCV